MYLFAIKYLFELLFIITFIYSYVEWSLHEPYPGIYNFEGIADLEYFLKLIKDENMYLLLRPGPYICAERDFVSYSIILSITKIIISVKLFICRVDFHIGY